MGCELWTLLKNKQNIKKLFFLFDNFSIKKPYLLKTHKNQ